MPFRLFDDCVHGSHDDCVGERRCGDERFEQCNCGCHNDFEYDDVGYVETDAQGHPWAVPA